MKRLLLLGLLFPILTAGAAERDVASLSDPANDDRGGGTLVYPQRAGFAPGDLDLLSLRVVRGDREYRFEATFRNPIRNPASVSGDVGPEPLSYFAHRGFYAFNLDIYIDQDRIRGSGNTYTLPGRGVSIDASYAWEKAVILTPRPELIRKQLIDAVTNDEAARDPEEVARRIDTAILFPTQVQVRGRTISFSVPADALAGKQPDTDWAITAFVTGAKTSADMDLDVFDSPGAALRRLTLGVMQPKPGHPRDTFGYSGAGVAPSPIVDLLAPEPLKQQELLSGKMALVGLAWGAGGAAAKEGGGTPVTRIANTPPSAPAGSDSTAAERGDIAARLRALNGLHDQGLISEQEYQELRRKILSEL